MYQTTEQMSEHFDLIGFIETRERVFPDADKIIPTRPSVSPYRKHLQQKVVQETRV